MQEMIEDEVFHLFRTDLCAPATEELDGAVKTTKEGGLTGGVAKLFSMVHVRHSGTPQ